MRAVVVALGKVGLPLAAQIARAGHEVVGCDIDERVCALVNAGRAPFPGEDGLAEALAELVPAGRLRAQTDTTAAVREGADLVVAVPPLVVDDAGLPDFAILDAVVDAIGRGLQRGTTVSFETTVPVGTTRERFGPRLEELSGLSVERDFFLVFSPERVYSGRVFRDLATYPKLVGGVGPRSEAHGVELYGKVLDAEVWPMGSADAAELAKLSEAVYRHLNIALANELARYADRLGINSERVIAAANSQPFSHIHRPGVAVGGHCIPVYPHFYLAGDPDARLPRVADEVNGSMPGYAADILAQELEGLEGQDRGDPGRRLPRRGEGDGVLGRLSAARRARAARRGGGGGRPALQRRGARPRRAFAPGRASPSRARSSRPTTASTRRWRRATCRACGPSSTDAGMLDAAALVAGGVRVRRIGRP